MSAPKPVLNSMTGYGRGGVEEERFTLSTEVRTVNSRFLDVRLRLPRELNALDARVRALIGRFFRRGQVDVSVRVKSVGDGESGVVIDAEAATGYAREAERLRQQLGLQGELELSTLLGLPGVARLREPELEEQTAVAPALLRAAEEACAEALAMRVREGAALEAELRERLSGLGAAVTEIEARADEVKRGVRARLEKRLGALAPEIEIDPARLAQEVVLYSERMDVTEETVRLRSHLAQFQEALALPGPVGRKLEFLLQEIGREVNTIGSKAADAPLSRVVVELKTELEKLREQVLNVE